MSEWKEHKLGDLITLEYGKSLSGYQESNSKYPVYGTNGIIGNTDSFLSPIPSVIIGRKGAYRGVHFSKYPFYVIDTAFYIKPKDVNIDLLFLYYFLSTQDINAMDSGSAIPSTDRYEIYDIDIFLPPLPKQRAIAGLLSSLDDKIDLLHRQNKTLEGIAEALWRKMFMEEAEPGWIEKPLGNFFPILTGKKDANYATEDGQYPFFTCSQKILNSPGYSFDGHAILLAGNGDFNLKRYKGKFEAYQRTYVLIPFKELEVGFLYYGMRQHLDDITRGYRGSVINFITKAMIENFQLPVMPDPSVFHEACRRFNEINRKIDSSILQIRTISGLRDTLLPKLMSGQVRVKYN